MGITRAKTVTTSRQSAARNWGARAALAAVGVAATGLAVVTPAQAAPLWPGGPDIPGVPQLIGADPIVAAPTITPATGSIVGGLQPIDVFFATPVVDRSTTERSIRVVSNPGVAGSFEWISDKQVQWKPEDFWPRGTVVNVDVAGAHSSFAVSDQMTSVGDAGAHTFDVKIGNDVVRSFPASFGKPTHKTPNGTFPVMELDRNIVMDSSTYGVPVNSPEGYKVDVEYATRLTWSGIFVHAAPWSVADQGNSNVSHGCINLSTENAKWFFDNSRVGDTVTIVNA